jgi:CDGSH-type Zn-finger protein
VSVPARSSTVPLSVRLPVGLEQPVAEEVVQALVLAGAAARRSGRVVADAGDLLAALAELASDEDAAPGRAASDPSIGSGDRPPPPTQVTPYRNGPYLLRGRFALTDQDGNAIPSQRRTIALCRCGRSQLRPFCDGTHKLIGFQAESGAERAAAVDD